MTDQLYCILHHGKVMTNWECARCAWSTQSRGSYEASHPLVRPVVYSSEINRVERMLCCEVVARESGPRADTVLRVVVQVWVIVAPESLLTSCDHVIGVY